MRWFGFASSFFVTVLPAGLSVSHERLERAFHDVGAQMGGHVAALARTSAAPPVENFLPEPAAPVVSDWSAPAEVGLDATTGVVAQSGAKHKGKKTRARSPEKAPTPSVFVSAAQVLAFAAHRMIPGGQFVPATPEHPAGIAFQNVAMFGVGVRDGDVLTEVAGTPVTARGQVVGAVLAVRARHEKHLFARFYRGSQPFSLVVEMPYPDG